MTGFNRDGVAFLLLLQHGVSCGALFGKCSLIKVWHQKHNVKISSSTDESDAFIPEQHPLP